MLSKSLRTDSVNLSSILKKMEVQRLKGKIVSSAVSKLISTINSIAGSVDCKIVKSNTDKLSGDRLFNGILVLSTSVTDKGTRKSIDVPVRVTNSVPTIPSKPMIERKLAQIENTNSAEKRFAHLSENVVKAITEREEKVKKIAEENKTKKEETKEKKAEEVKLPSGGFTYVPSANVAKTIRYPKANLPQSIKAGDTIDVGGRKYKVEDGLNSFQGAQPSTEWNLVLQES
jgi:hypothetical protein